VNGVVAQRIGRSDLRSRGRGFDFRSGYV